MDEQKMTALETKIDQIYLSVEKTRKYFLWTLFLSIVFFLLPLFGLMFAIPYVLNTMLGGYGDLLR